MNFGTIAVGSTGSPTPVSFTFTSGGSGVTASVVTQGAKGLDFADAGTGSCDTNGSSYTYSAGDTCTVNVTFKPTLPNIRYGAVVLSGASGAIATAYVYGTGEGPQLVFPDIPDNIVVLGTKNEPLAFSNPTGVAVDGSGNVYVADHGTTQ